MILRFEGVSKEFPVAGAPFPFRSPARRRAVDQVSLEVRAGETYALVGESGCGKTTLARLGVGLLNPDRGRVLVGGQELTGALRRPGRARAAVRRQVQMVFQDPASALDPRQLVEDAVGEPLALHRAGPASGRRHEVRRLLELVGLGPSEGRRFPHQLSGGQKQRVLIARALALQPDLVILDEPVSALDVSVRAQILNLLLHIQRQRGLAYFLVSHDLALVRQVAGRLGVMHAGRLVEEGPPQRVFERPGHPYTQALLGAVLSPDPATRGEPPAGPPPEPAAPAEAGSGAAARGCLYAGLCPRAMRHCRRLRPEPHAVEADHLVACFQPGA